VTDPGLSELDDWSEGIMDEERASLSELMDAISKLPELGGPGVGPEESEC
jgi:hypothetical protein